MVIEKKIKDMCFCIIPGLVGLTIILFSITAGFSDELGIYMNASWVFFWVFLGIVLISYNAITYYNLCKYEQ